MWRRHLHREDEIGEGAADSGVRRVVAQRLGGHLVCVWVWAWVWAWVWIWVWVWVRVWAWAWVWVRAWVWVKGMGTGMGMGKGPELPPGSATRASAIRASAPLQPRSVIR